MNKIKSIPFWQSDEIFEINSLEMETILNVLNKLPDQTYFVEHLISRFIDEKKISVAYQDESGNSVTQEELITYLRSSLDQINDESIEPKI